MEHRFIYEATNKEDRLEHFGIPKMKWGVRNPLGPDGRIIGSKYSKASPSHEKLIKSTRAKEVYKHRSELSDQELRDRVNRIQTEQNLKRLSDNEDHKVIQYGKKIASTAIISVGTALAIDALKHGPNSIFVSKGKEFFDSVLKSKKEIWLY